MVQAPSATWDLSKSVLNMVVAMPRSRAPFSCRLLIGEAKVRAGFKNSEGFDLGAVWTSKDKGRVKIYSEFLLGRNDPYVGAGQYVSGAAQGGDNKRKPRS